MNKPYYLSMAILGSCLLPAVNCYAGSMGPSTPVWDGPYLGGYIGGAWANSDITTNSGPAIPGVTYFVADVNVNSVNQSGSGTVKSRVFIGGVQAGNNWTANSLLYGVALDFGSFSFNKNIAANNVPFPTVPTFTYSTITSANTDWLFTARARLGYLVDSSRFLLYGTGGVALTDLQVENSYSDLNITRTSNKKTNKVGWTAGAGAELFVTQNLTLNAEYLFVDFNKVATSFTLSPIGLGVSTVNTSANLTANLFRVGLNYKF
ncbi:MAG: porin family protein [Legionella sp.]|nr:MAG: porin family protein [Legionella sp.]